MIRAAIAAKRSNRVMAITDGTAAAGLAPGARARLGGQPIVASESGARLADGTLAGSTIAMDDAFRLLVGPVGLTPVEAAALCSTTPARELGLARHGVLAIGAAADFVVLDGRLSVVRTYIGGELAYER
jgi:N-acetylglucosamine-6-phosphate deacetylase